MKKTDYGKTKRCPHCDLTLSIKSFKWRKVHYDSWCIRCRSEVASAFTKNKRAKEPRYEMLRAAKRRSRKRGTQLSITLDDIIIPEFCPILGLPLRKGVGEVLQNSPSLDEIRVGLGYVPGNVQVISNKANAMKSNATLEEIVILGQWAKRVLRKGA